MTPAKLAELRAFAERATPGPWRWGRPDSDLGRDVDTMNLYPSRDNERGVGFPILFLEPASGYVTAAANSDYIAAVDPQTVIALLDLVEAARAPEAHWECQQRIDRLEEQLAAANAEIGRLVANESVYSDERDRIDELSEQLAAALAAKDEACEIAERWHRDPDSDLDRIAALRSVGKGPSHG